MRHTVRNKTYCRLLRKFIRCYLLLAVVRQDSIQPHFGPVAGGTVVNLTGYWPYLASSYAINFVNINQSMSQTMSMYVSNTIFKYINFVWILNIASWQGISLSRQCVVYNFASS